VHGKIRRKIYCPECTRLAEEMQNFMIEIRDHLTLKKAQKEGAGRKQPGKLKTSERIRDL
jgi:hypothetical protein